MKSLDVVLCGALAVLVVVYAFAAIGLDDAPEEDAAMLLRYARHLADGHGMAWNIGEPPVDGATDFLFVLAVAAVSRAGPDAVTAAKAVGLAAHVATVILVYMAVRRLHDGARPLALLSAVYLAMGPALRYVAASYGTTLFALCVGAVFWSATRLVAAPAGAVGRAATAFGLLGLVMGLARPEGALLAAFCLAAVLYAREADRRAIIVRFVLAFGVLGLAYFFWRWSYFGHPLPNPFYRRGGGVLYPDVLARSVRSLWRLAAPFLILIAAGLLRQRTRRLALFVAIPVVLFTMLWVFFSDEANYYMRYWYPWLPIVLIGWLPVARGLALNLPLPSSRWVVAALSLVLVTATAIVQHRRFSYIRSTPIGLYDVARGLSALQAKGFTLVTTEAGLLPLYSGWRSIDAWGLNDAWIAHNGGVTPEYLDRYRPEVVMFHAYFSPENEATPPEARGLGRAWARMVSTLKQYAEERGYTLAAVYAKHRRESHYYYVRPGFLDHDKVVSVIRRESYPWGGNPALDLTPRPAGRRDSSP